MNKRNMADRLEALPPPLPDPVDRFEQVRGRVRRRRRAQVGAVAAGVAALAVAVSAGWQLLPESAAPSPAGPGVVQKDRVAPTDLGPALPGGVETTTYGTPRIATYTGTATVDLGERPDQATGVRIDFHCLSPGAFTWPDGGELHCSASDVGQEHPPWDVVDLGPEVEEVTFETTRGTPWRVTTTYVSTRTTEWGVNANGDTFGVENENGTPDLTGVTATNGRIGYAYWTEMENAGGPPPTSPEEAGARQSANEGKTFTVPVYKSDGETRIGEFMIGG